MKKLNNSHQSAALQYLSAEPEFNLFLIGDMEQFGVESEWVSCYTSAAWQEGMDFPYFILNYRNNFLVYSHTSDYSHLEVAEFLEPFHPQNLSGKDEIVTPLLPYMMGKVRKPTYMARLNQMIEPLQEISSLVRRLTLEDIPAIYDLYLQIEEFAYTYRDIPREKAYEDIVPNVQVMGRSYGIFHGSTLISIAQTSAESRTCAMVIGVATLPSERGHGYASAVVAKLCNDCLEEGMDFLCLFYDNPSAGRIYRSMGFLELGIFTMIRNQT